VVATQSLKTKGDQCMDTTAQSPAFDINTPIGFIGLGAMGAPMARHLATLGYALVVHDFNESAVKSVVACGARAMCSAREVADEASIVLLCLPSLRAIREVIFGVSGAAGGASVRVVVDFSTTGADFAREMAEALKARDIALLDSPITGNVKTAGNGTLGIMCSGPRPAFERVAQVLQALASAIVLYLGEESGKAQTLKLLNNMLSATGMASACEAFILGVKGGLAPSRMLEIVNSGDASSSASRNKFARSVLPRKFDFGARMAITAKDISLSVEEAQNRGVPMWVAQTVQQLWKFAAMQGGYDRDGTSLITYLEPWSGVEVFSRGDMPSCLRNFSSTSKGMPVVFLCDESTRDAVTHRLTEHGYRLDSVESDMKRARFGSGASLDTTITLLVIAREDSPPVIFDRVREIASEDATIVNTVPMQVTQVTSLAQMLMHHSNTYCDALHTGTQRDIANAEGVLIVGGEAAAIQAVGPILKTLCGHIYEISERPGDAHLMLHIHASLFATLLAVTSEAFVAGAKAGLEPEQMTKIMGIETGRNAASSRILPAEVATRRFDYGMTLAQIYIRLSSVADEARRLGVTTWIFDKVRGIYGLAQEFANPGDDVTTIARQYEKWAGVEVKSRVLSQPNDDRRMLPGSV
jgi:3-hydroxyisobutyrate dehydrogenase-like beta-hydroxyacid dehydrogenase